MSLASTLKLVSSLSAFRLKYRGMARVRLLHWKAAEAEPVVQALLNSGHTVEYEEQFRTELMREWRKSPPDIFVIDLSRLPSHGRELAIAIRQSPTTRGAPIVFCQGEKEKVARLRTLLPDATYCDIKALGKSVKAALHAPAVEMVAPVAMMERYGDRTTAQKLGIKGGSTLWVRGSPPHLERVLGELPPAVQVVESEADVTLCFLHDVDSVRRAFSELRGRAGKTRLWMLWRKKASTGHAGVTEPLVRETGLSLGLVDYKICSVDKDWSAMLFARKK
jgi:CheY-like chemotaxis protein